VNPFQFTRHRLPLCNPPNYTTAQTTSSLRVIAFRSATLIGLIADKFCLILPVYASSPLAPQHD